MNLTRHTYATRNEKTIDFIIGFVGWFVLNGLLAGLIGAAVFGLSTLPLPSSPPGSSDTAQALLGLVMLAINCLPWLINLGLLIYFGLTRYWIALGALAAFGVLIALVVCASLVFLAYCFTGGFNF